MKEENKVRGIYVNLYCYKDLYQLSGAAIKVLLGCLCAGPDIRKDLNEVLCNKQFIDELSEASGLKQGTIRNCLSQLYKHNILIKLDNYRSIYNINPKYLKVL